MESQLTSLKELLTGIARAHRNIGEVLKNVSSGIDDTLVLNQVLNESLNGLEEGLGDVQKYLEIYFLQYPGTRLIRFNPYSQFVSKDYRYALIRVNLDDMNDTEQTSFLSELDELIQEKKGSPAPKSFLLGALLRNTNFASRYGL